MPLIYSVVCHDPKSQTIFPVADFITTSFKQSTTTRYLREIKTRLENYKSGILPKIIITDMAWGLINSVLECFNQCDIHDFLRQCYNFTVLKNKNTNLKVIYYTCSTHYLKNMSKKVKCKCKALII